MAGKAREHALPLLAAANNHGDLAIKLSSLRQAKDILVSAETSLAADLFPYLVEIQSSPETLVRKYLLEVIEEIVVNGLEHSSILMPVLLTLLKDNSSIVVKQAIVTGTNIFCIVLEELSLQFQQRGIVERWLEELWTWMVKFKDVVLGIFFEGGTVGPKLLAIKFLEKYVLLFTADASDSDKYQAEVITRTGRAFNISWLGSNHPVLNAAALTADAFRIFTLMLDLLRSASSLPGLLTISIVNSLAMIARKRPAHYSTVFYALLEFNTNFELSKGGHMASIQYSVRTALLGFLRCAHPTIMESRERLLKALRGMNAGEAADQVIRQVEKMMRNNERVSRDARSGKDEQPSNYIPASGDLTKKRLSPMDNEDLDGVSKRTRYGPNHHAAPPVETNHSGQDNVNGVSPKASLLDSELTPVEQMIAMIGALIAEGERGVESLEILISRIHPDLLADIVITNMKHLPRNPPSLAKVSNLSSNQQSDSSGPAQVVGSVSSPTSLQIPVTSAQMPISSAFSDMSTSMIHGPDSKRDPRRDPRRLDPRRAAAPVGVQSDSIAEDNGTAVQSGSLQPDSDVPSPFNKTLSDSSIFSSENILESLVPETESDTRTVEGLVTSGTRLPAPKEEIEEEEIKEIIPDREVKEASDISLFSVSKVEESRLEDMKVDAVVVEEVYSPSLEEIDELSPSLSTVATSEDANVDLPVLPAYVELTQEQQRNVGKLAVERIIDSDKNLQGTEFKQTRMALLARLATQIVVDDDDNNVDVVMMMQKHIISDYQQQKGHELVMHVLYHLHTLMALDSVEKSPSPAAVYEKFLLGVAKALLDSLPATDKSFSRLLGEAPWLPDSVMRLLDNVCSKCRAVKEGRESDRVTQGLGAVWSLILARPLDRQACLDIALKCAIHSQDDIRAKAIRLVANKLYVLCYISENIEQFATNMFLSAVDQHVSDADLSHSGVNEQRMEREVGSQETSISGSQISEPAVSENECVKGAQLDAQTDSSVSFARAQSLISLFFALCTKKPGLLQLVFETYGRAPKSVKQAVHRHIPVLIRALGSSYSELLRIISDPPVGSENLLTQVLRILSEETATPSDLIATVKHLYETKLKDATILIPVLSSFSKSEVLPIFPRLIDLPLDKVQMALAHILQGSAHTGPALTPTEVLVAIHDINPEKDGLPLKKITDACSACFEQRTVFTQQVLAKALNQMVDQTPVPLLFMRTVIQAIDAFPTLVDFVMEILSKLVSRQVWRMPKLWVGFLKCVSQTQPHSFCVLLQLPPPQLESALNKYPNLRGPLAAFANQPSVKNALPRSALVVLGLANESQLPQQHTSSSLHTADASSSVHGATLT